MEGQSGANLTSMTMSSHLCEFKSSGIGDHNTMTNPLPTGGGLEAGAQESPSTIDVELEDDVVPPDKDCSKAAYSIVTVLDKELWGLCWNSHTATIQWVHMVVDPLLPTCT